MFYRVNFRTIIYNKIFIIILFIGGGGLSYAEIPSTNLTMKYASQIAVERDFIIRSYTVKSQALLDESIALNTLPDPKLKLGLVNFPDDTYSQNQEAMTQKKIGIAQYFPKGDSLEIKAKRAIIGSDKNILQANERKRKVIESTRKAWLEVYYWVKAKKILDENRILFKDLVKITEGQYAAGKRRQFDLVQAQIELDLLNDQDYMFSEREQVSRAELARWVGSNNSKLDFNDQIIELHDEIKGFNILDKFDDNIYKKIMQHPIILLSKNKISYDQKTVELARQDYRPGWSVDISYGIRDKTVTGIERQNTVSALVMVDIPLFTRNRQDKRVASKLKQVSASKNNLDDSIQVLNSRLEKAHSRLIWLKQRIKHYKSVLFSRAEQNSAAAIIAYQSDRSDFVSLVKARIIEFNTELQFLRLNVDHVSTEATLSYLIGD